MNKTNEKKRTSVSVVWPKTETFTIKPQLFDLNPDMKFITLRVRLQKRIENGEIMEIGSIPGGQGRPRKVFAYTPVTDTILAKAKSDGITLLPQSQLQKPRGSVLPVIPLVPKVSSVVVA